MRPRKLIVLIASPGVGRVSRLPRCSRQRMRRDEYLQRQFGSVTFGVDADHERNGPYRSVYARRIITRGPRATSSRFQVIFLPLLEFGKTCLAEVPDRPISPPVLASRWVIQATSGRFDGPWPAGPGSAVVSQRYPMLCMACMRVILNCGAILTSWRRHGLLSS